MTVSAPWVAESARCSVAAAKEEEEEEEMGVGTKRLPQVALVPRWSRGRWA